MTLVQKHPLLASASIATVTIAWLAYIQSAKRPGRINPKAAFHLYSRHVRGIAFYVMLFVFSTFVVGTSWYLSARYSRPNPDAVSILARPHYDMPYGYAYFQAANGQSRQIRAFPLLLRHMHARSLESHSLTEPNQTIREAYRITITNPSRERSIVTEIHLHVTDYKKLPKLYVSAWHRKGIKEAERVDFVLTPESMRINLLGDEQYVELSAEETFILIANVASAEPGVYTFRFDVSLARMTGASDNWSSKEFSLLVPSIDPDGTTGVSVANLPLEKECALRILRLSNPTYEVLRQETNPLPWVMRTISEPEAQSALPLSDDEFLWAKNGVTP